MNRGIVTKTTGSQYWVRNESGEIITCRMKGVVRLQELKSTNPAVVGDHINYSIEKNGDGVIESIEPRHNYIVRKSIKLSSQKHILAANIDRVLLIATLNFPKTHLEFIDRYLVTAEAYHIPAILIFNKKDRYNAKLLKELDRIIRLYKSIGYPCFAISATEEENLNEVKEFFKKGTVLLSGHSGVGKSTLINSISPGLKLRTSEISEYHRSGKHTTTYAEMHALPGMGYVIDTPGIKGLGVLDIPKDELSHYFLEMRAILHQCKYNNCVHIDEPDCAIKAALAKGEIDPSRYRSYISLYEESGGNFRKPDYL